MKVATQKVTVLSRGDDAFSLDANAAWPTLNLTSHMIISRIAIQQLHWILTHLPYDTTCSNSTMYNCSGQMMNVMTTYLYLWGGQHAVQHWDHNQSRPNAQMNDERADLCYRNYVWYTIWTIFKKMNYSPYSGTTLSASDSTNDHYHCQSGQTPPIVTLYQLQYQCIFLILMQTSQIIITYQVSMTIITKNIYTN